MWTGIRGIVLALVLAGGILPIGSQSARANEDVSDCDDIDPEEEHLHEQLEGWVCLADALSPLKQPLSVESKQAAIATPVAGIQRLATVDGTLQPGEPKEPGMTRTGWVSFKAPVAARIVVHTFGSKAWDSGAFDPLLAAYRGKALNNLARITGNDNKPLAGISNVQSLIQFNTVAGNYYSIQIGGKNGIEGDVSLNVFSFPPSGGLSAFLIHYDNNTVNPFNARDYSCELTTTTTSVFCNAKFIVHNSTNKTLTVTPSTTLGAGITGPAPFSLAPGALKVVTFVFNATTFNKTVRTVSGHFIFTGRADGAVVSEARHRALVVVRPNTLVEDLITSKATPQVQTAHVNEPVTFTSTITNTGAVNAIGCHFRSELYSSLKTTFYSINPANGARLTPDNVPLNIAAGQSRTFKVLAASQGTRDADFIDPEVVADCANNDRRAFNLRRGFDVSASAVAEPLPSLNVTSSVPANGVLTVPGTGNAFFTFRVKNTQTTKRLDVLPAYVGPFDDPANSNYPVKICRTDVSTGECLGSYNTSVSFNAVKGTVYGLSVRVQAPQVATPFDADKRRVYVNFKMADAPYFHIAAPSVAVKTP